MMFLEPYPSRLHINANIPLQLLGLLCAPRGLGRVATGLGTRIGEPWRRKEGGGGFGSTFGTG